MTAIKTDDINIFALLTRHKGKLIVVASMISILVTVIIYQTLFGKIEQNKRLVEIKKGQSYYGMMATWQEQVPLFSDIIAKLYIKTKTGNALQEGTYQLPANPSFWQAINLMSNPSASAMIKIQIVEGKTAQDLYSTLKSLDGINIEVLNSPKNLKSKLGIRAFTPSGAYVENLEGWFSPNTYMYSRGTSDKKILLDLYNRQQKILDDAWNGRAKDLPYKTAYEALIMASIIEKETSLASERSEVAGVFVNRLRIGMRLQTDPTIIYGMGDSYKGDIRRSDLKKKTAYNTYQIDGLPPTPIALPSEASIKAALHPATTEALYFVATGQGGHKFSSSLAEHNRAVQEYLKFMREQD